MIGAFILQHKLQLLNDVPEIPAKHMRPQCNAIKVMMYAEFVLFLIIYCSFKEFWVSFTYLLSGPIHNIIWDNKCLHRLTYCIQARVSTFFFISFTYDKKKIAKPYWEFKKKIFTCNTYMIFSIKNWRRIIYLVNVFACRIDEFVIFDKGNRMLKND